MGFFLIAAVHNFCFVLQNWKKKKIRRRGKICTHNEFHLNWITRLGCRALDITTNRSTTEIIRKKINVLIRVPLSWYQKKIIFPLRICGKAMCLTPFLWNCNYKHRAWKSSQSLSLNYYFLQFLRYRIL